VHTASIGRRGELLSATSAGACSMCSGLVGQLSSHITMQKPMIRTWDRNSLFSALYCMRRCQPSQFDSRWGLVCLVLPGTAALSPASQMGRGGTHRLAAGRSRLPLVASRLSRGPPSQAVNDVGCFVEEGVVHQGTQHGDAKIAGFEPVSHSSSQYSSTVVTCAPLGRLV
jgi:hypothetical protein